MTRAHFYFTLYDMESGHGPGSRTVRTCNLTYATKIRQLSQCRAPPLPRIPGSPPRFYQSQPTQYDFRSQLCQSQVTEYDKPPSLLMLHTFSGDHYQHNYPTCVFQCRHLSRRRHLARKMTKALATSRKRFVVPGQVSRESLFKSTITWKQPLADQ